MTQRQPHPRNVSGDFYVEDQCCTACELPLTEAPDLFAICKDPSGHHHCFVSRQPHAPDEMDRMVRAIEWAELDCIRYRGIDRNLQLRLVELGDGPQCDALAPDLERRSRHLRARMRRRARAADLKARLLRWLKR